MNGVLNKARLLKINSLIPLNHRNNPDLRYFWYITAATTLSVCNQPKDVATLYKYAIITASINNNNNNNNNNATDVHHIKLGLDNSCNDQDLLISTILGDNHELSLREANFTLLQKNISSKFKEAILKSSCIAGIPKAINSLHEIAQSVEKENLHETTTNNIEDKFRIKIHAPDFNRISDYNQYVTENNHNKRENILARGFDHWNLIYNKVSDKIINNLNASDPDLWYIILSTCYAPILSNDSVLNAKETSLIVISALVPQDVNPQLYGHLKGALNVGCTKEEVQSVEDLSILISEWCGITWKRKCIKL
ncbi:Pxp2p SCDLUD_000070 [Saccharomycodes ludwigii]|uniref:Pxp2p n=1 Tax=Saccharomycodes ludwigii TaxID=36035 RepID=UPI001E87103D|nr:hypothetical protein SCDLUD_000070 [Saccharomycodes ludwigii]KAH3902493.1 hypothetical protein SCDLUD_000070 [Saccharomycodes ludwigii]